MSLRLEMVFFLHFFLSSATWSPSSLDFLLLCTLDAHLFSSLSSSLDFESTLRQHSHGMKAQSFPCHSRHECFGAKASAACDAVPLFFCISSFHFLPLLCLRHESLFLCEFVRVHAWRVPECHCILSSRAVVHEMNFWFSRLRLPPSFMFYLSSASFDYCISVICVLLSPLLFFILACFTQGVLLNDFFFLMYPALTYILYLLHVLSNMKTFSTLK